eukprot:CAMPEP_0203881154 /NCGR_PEP_ID=MMETSP0359-20131031/25493_1 /ASSEMBLY_ACC=CAM_ASM_000338 /TAXON_ID=268821 /ORGANISM="Scrippsiella Hangoei, Strain SHTV-5" /LENGTH=52 /DNA_ID=CAMNT_0050800921 /DNA_START=10 /DNA_END=165 /DNA_ORIENTATION=+
MCLLAQARCTVVATILRCALARACRISTIITELMRARMPQYVLSLGFGMSSA